MVIVLVGIFIALLLAAVYIRLTNPFIRFTIVNDPLRNFDVDNDLDIPERHTFKVRKRKVFKAFALYKAGYHILANAWTRKKRVHHHTLEEIIDNIHHLRFRRSLPFLISGDHFSSLYPRSLGIFYYSLLDPRISSTDEDWENRQHIYAKTLYYALKVFNQSEQLATTIVPISRHSVALLNIYAYPSDTLYSLLVAFENLLSTQSIEKRYPFSSQKYNKLETQPFAQKLLEKYRTVLKGHWITYSRDVIDTTTGLIKMHWLLSGTKDMAKRKCAFYDNVIYWKTMQLVQQLGIIPPDIQSLAELKQRIIDTFWDEGHGLFLEDLGEKSLTGHLASSDWLIAYQVGFLTPEIQADRAMLEKAVQTIIDSQLDQPFGLPYHKDRRDWQLYLPVQLAAPLYGSQVIWSHWGIEYIKLLAHLGTVTKNPQFTTRAHEQCDLYEKNIRETGGYPEVYDPKGKPYSHHGYTSVYQTGWIINFEQARAMVLNH